MYERHSAKGELGTKRNGTEMEDISEHIKLNCCTHCVNIFVAYQKPSTQVQEVTANKVKFS